MKKILLGFDTTLSFLFPLMACSFLIYEESDFSTYILLVGWLMFLLNGVALVHAAKPKFYSITAVWSLVNIIGLIVLVSMGFIELGAFLILELMCEAVSYPLAIFLFVITNQKINGEPFWKKMGVGMAIMNVIIISAIAYPFVMEWIIFMNDSDSSLVYWLASISSIVVAVVKKGGVLREVVVSVNSQTLHKRNV
jgi:hypothetical protein